MASEKQVKQSEKNLVETLTKRQATRGRVVSLPKSYKRVAATFSSKEQRRQYLNMALDIVSTQKESSMFRNKGKKEDLLPE